jgi:hypothetical protein
MEADSTPICPPGRGSGRLARFRGAGSLCDHLLNATIGRHPYQQVINEPIVAAS